MLVFAAARRIAELRTPAGAIVLEAGRAGAHDPPGRVVADGIGLARGLGAIASWRALSVLVVVLRAGRATCVGAMRRAAIARARAAVALACAAIGPAGVGRGRGVIDRVRAALVIAAAERERHA